MIILKHVEYIIQDKEELKSLLKHLEETISKVDGVELKDIYFPKGKNEFVLELDCANEEKYLEWREICPPPTGAKDWYEVLLTTNEHFSEDKTNKSVRIKPEPSELTKKIFQHSCEKENTDAKFGKSLMRDENDIRRFILSQAPVLGRIPSIDEIKRAFPGTSSEKVNEILGKLDRLDVIHLDDEKSSIMAAYPFSGSRTSHLITLKGDNYKDIFAMCAIDALGTGFMFDCDVSIKSSCHHCNDEVEIEIRKNEITSLIPEDVVVWCDMEYSGCAATSFCRNINFFSSRKHFSEWQDGRKRRNGHLLRIEEAFHLGRLFFENRLGEKPI
jgi:hypothetical protein